MDDAHFPRILDDAEDDKIVTNLASAIAHAAEDWIAAELMRGRKLFKVCVGLSDSIRKRLRRLLVFKFVGDILEGVEQVGVGRR